MLYLYLRDFQIDVHNWVNFQIHISQFRHSYYSCILQYHSSSVDLFSSRASSLPWLTWEWTPTFALLSSFLALLGWEHLDHLAELFWVVTWRCASRFWSWISLWKFYVMNFSIETRHATVFWWSGDENVLTWSQTPILWSNGRLSIQQIHFCCFNGLAFMLVLWTFQFVLLTVIIGHHGLAWGGDHPLI